MALPTPKQLAEHLHQVADKIANSKNPDPTRVAAHLQRLASQVAGEGWIDAGTLVDTLKKALSAGKLTPEQEKHAKEMIESMEPAAKEEKVASSPKQMSDALRQIAAKIDASKNPDKALVTQDIELVIAALE